MRALIVGPAPDGVSPSFAVNYWFGEEVDRRTCFDIMPLYPAGGFSSRLEHQHIPTVEALDEYLLAQEEAPEQVYLIVSNLPVPSELRPRIQAFLREQLALPGVYSSVGAALRTPWLLEQGE